MRARLALGFCLAISVTVAGCVLDIGSGPAGNADAVALATALPPVAIGDRASYEIVGSLINYAVDVHVASVGEVRDGSNRTVRSLLVERTLHNLDAQRSFVFTEAVNTSTGGIHWVMQHCPFAQAVGGCDDKHAFFFTVNGTPGLFGRGWLSHVISGSTNADPSGRLRSVGNGCFLLSGEGHPFVAEPHEGFTPQGHMEGDEYWFCKDIPFPAEVRVPGLGLARLVSYQRGNGSLFDVRYTQIPSTAPLHPQAVPWNGHYPPGPEWPNSFTLAEAWGWAENNSSELKAFLSEYPAALIHSSIIDKTGNGSTPNAPVVGSLDYGHYSERLMRIQSQDGDMIEVRLRKTENVRGLPPEIAQVGATEVKGAPTLSREVSPDRLLSPLAATKLFMDRVRGNFISTDILSFRSGISPADEAVTGYYAYRVRLSPPGEGTGPGVSISFSLIGVVRADSGVLLYAIAPEELVFPGLE